MNAIMIFLATAFAGYAAFELFFMALNAGKERRICVVLQIAFGFCMCIWVVIDQSVISWPVFLGLGFIMFDRLQTRLMSKKR
jgi:hypothetical protein